jgi:hypothetical protein
MYRRCALAGLAFITVTTACGDKAATHVKTLGDYYAPGFGSGAPLSAEAKARYHLEPIGNVGFADTTYVGPDGVHVLAVMLAGPNGEAGRVTVGLPSRAVFLRVLAHVNRELGAPTHDLCFGSDAASASRMLIWRTSRGKDVSITGTPAAWSTAPDAELDSLATKSHALALNDNAEVGSITHQACPTG